MKTSANLPSVDDVDRTQIRKPLEVFLSSTSALQVERSAIRAAIDRGRFNLFSYESISANGWKPKSLCALKIDQSLFGRRQHIYGYES